MIEVGEYVRTKKGIVGKFKKYLKSIYFQGQDIELENYIIFLEDEDEVVKHSKNITDLIEVGDYVNGKKVIEADNCKGAIRELYLEGQNPDKDCGIYFEQIETVVTKEQFKSIEYRLEN